MADHPEAPTVSVVIPAWNCQEVLDDQLAALAAQDFSLPFEVIVADNGSTDGTADLARRWAERDARFTHLDASRRQGASAARNDGASAAKGEKVLFCDADDIVASDWVRLMAAGLDEHDVVGGWLAPFLDRPGDIHGSGRSAIAPFGDTHFVISASMGIERSAFDRSAGFDESWGPGEDIELSLRLLDSGLKFGRVDPAVVHKRVANEPRDVWRQHFRYGVQRARAAAAFRDHKGRVNLVGVLKKWIWLAVRLPLRWRDRNILGPAAMSVGRLVGSIKYRVVYL